VKRFAHLFQSLEGTTKTNAKIDAMVDYFRQTPPRDAAWAIYFLCGRKPKRAINSKQLQEWAREVAQLPNWLFAESYDAVGDLAETIALLLPPAQERSDVGLADWVENQLLPMKSWTEVERKEAVIRAWNHWSNTERLIGNKLITGGFRVGVSQSLVVRALAKWSGLPTATLTHRLMGEWSPTEEFLQRLIQIESTIADASKPYPFFLAHPLEGEPNTLGPASDWQAEWKWDGIRSQLISRVGEIFLWSRGEELVTDRYPELRAMATQLPVGTVLDGELLPWKEDRVQPFAELQKRIGRKSVTKKLLSDIPVSFMAYDLLEWNGIDLRETPLRDRREKLETLVREVAHDKLKLSPRIDFVSWEVLLQQRSESRSLGVEGVMLKRLESPYRVGRITGDWWKWKIEPLTMDAVLTAAQPGHGKRASLFTDYTFSVWNGEVLVTVAKAYSGLTDQEIREVDAFVRANTLEKFGPVRTVKPLLVFELGFEGIQSSTRHKSGLAVRFPRILRPRPDKTPQQANTLEELKQLILIAGAR
jgi:DNA ligase-1